jgi:hypothetical protein
MITNIHHYDHVWNLTKHCRGSTERKPCVFRKTTQRKRLSIRVLHVPTYYRPPWLVCWTITHIKQQPIYETLNPSDFRLDTQYHTKITVKTRSPTNLFSTSSEQLPRQFLDVPYYTHGCLPNHSGWFLLRRPEVTKTPSLEWPDVTLVSTHVLIAGNT